MAFTLEHVEQIRNGHPKEVGQLPDEVWRKTTWPCPWVYLGQSGLEHITKEHPDVTDFDLLHLPDAIRLGMLVHLDKDVRKILAVRTVDPERTYLSALKSAQSGTEIWVDSFYRIDAARIPRIVGQGRVLRNQR